MLWLVRRDEALAEQTRIAEQGCRCSSLALEARIAELRATEARPRERLRADHYAAGDEVHAAQGRFYETNTEVTRLETEIRYVVDVTDPAESSAWASARVAQQAGALDEHRENGRSAVPKRLAS